MQWMYVYVCVKWDHSLYHGQSDLGHADQEDVNQTRKLIFKSDLYLLFL